MSQQWLLRVLSARKKHFGLCFCNGCNSYLRFHVKAISSIPKFYDETHHNRRLKISFLGSPCNAANLLPCEIAHSCQKLDNNLISSLNLASLVSFTRGFCSVTANEGLETECTSSDKVIENLEVPCVGLDSGSSVKAIENGETSGVESDNQILDKKPKVVYKKPIDFTKINANLLPAVMIIGRRNVGKSALYNRLIRRREALVYNTPDDHVTRDIREGIAKLGDLRFRVLDSAGLETEASSGSILGRTTAMTANVLARTQFAIFLIDVRVGLHPMDLEVGKWFRRHAPEIKQIVAMNKSESLDTAAHAEAASEALLLGFGEPIAISAETGLGMTTLYEVLRPLLEDYMVKFLNDRCDQANVSNEEPSTDEAEGSKLQLQLAIVGRPNVGKSTLLNMLLQEERVLVGPEAGLTRDAVRARFEFQDRTVYLVDTAGWLQRTERDKGPASLSIMQSRKSLMRAHIVALVLDAEEIAKARCSMNHAEVVIARRSVEEGRGLVVIVNKMDRLKGRRNAELYKKVKEAVPQEIQTVIPQVTGIPVVFISALEGRGRMAVMRQVIDTYEKWCLRLSTGRLNRWLRKVMSRHSWKDSAAQPKIKYFTQVKARPPTFVAFVSAKTLLSDTEVRFLTKSLKEDFDLGGIPIRILQKTVLRKLAGSSGQMGGRAVERSVA